MSKGRKRGRPGKGIEKELEELIAYDRRIPESKDYALIEGSNEEARAEESKRMQSIPLRDQSAYLAYRDFMNQRGFEPSKAKLKAFILDNRTKYKDAPGEDDLKGWTRVFRNSGLAFLTPPIVDTEQYDEHVACEKIDFNA